MATAAPPSGIGAFLEGVRVQAVVIGALLLRELNARFGRHNIGYLWLVAEPLMLASVVSTMHYASGAGKESAGAQPFAFTALGYCLFIIFRGIFTRAESAIPGGVSMLYHQIITPLDLMIAKALVEIAGCISSLTVLTAIGILLGIADLPARPLYLFLATLQIRCSWRPSGGSAPDRSSA